METINENAKMIGEINPVDISFKDICYSVPDPRGKGRKQLLKGISGKFKSGELTAIMGPSGAGKTSLLNILTGFIRSGVVGEIYFGKKPEKSFKTCSYILQDNDLFPWLTVQEIMLLAANLKISSHSMNMKAKHVLVDNVLSSLGLNHTKCTKCANLSGGQRKRLSIAFELLDNPAVLFLDEPTTGLDSSAASECVSLLKQLSGDSRTVICTIHQPSAAVFHTLSHVYVLAEGYCVYQGPPNHIVPFLCSVDLHCPQYHNAADYMLEVVNKEYGDHTQKLLEATKYNKLNFGEMSQLTSDCRKVISIRTTKYDKYIQPSSEWMKLWILVGRCQIQQYRDWTVTHLKFVCHILCAVSMGILFGDSGINASKTYSNVTMLLVGVLYIWYTTLMPSVLRFPLEISIIKNEVFNNWYRLRTYYLAAQITTIPIHVIFSLVFAGILYNITKQPLELDRFMKFALSLITITIAADGFGVLLGTLADPVNGTFFGAVMTAIFLAFSGCFIFLSHMSSAMRIFSHFSLHRYAFQNLILSVYDADRSDLICPPDIMYCHFKNPELILQMLGFNNGSYGANILVIIVVAVIVKTVAYWTLKRALRIY